MLIQRRLKMSESKRVFTVEKVQLDDGRPGVALHTVYSQESTNVPLAYQRFVLTVDQARVLLQDLRQQVASPE